MSTQPSAAAEEAEGQGEEKSTESDAEFVKVLYGAERLALEICAWVILVPRTLLKMTIHPKWGADYVSEQLKLPRARRYTDYMSPILMTALVGPAVLALACRRPLFQNHLSLDLIKKTSYVSLVLYGTACVLVLPVVGTVVIQGMRFAFNRARFDRQALERVFEVQCLCTAPLLLPISALGILFAGWKDVFWPITIAFFVLSIGGPTIWLLNEISAIRREFAGGAARTALLVAIFVLLFLAGNCLAFSLIGHSLGIRVGVTGHGG